MNEQMDCLWTNKWLISFEAYEEKSDDIETKRESSYELLRLISMLMIVIHHYAYHGQVDIAGSVTSQTLGLQVLTFGGNVGVLLFAMMGAYFLNGKSFKWRRLLQLILETWIFSLVILLFAIVFKTEPLTTHEVLDLLFPLPNVYWFLDYYLMLIIITPFI